ncbi:MAG: TrfA family protein [Deltaproteobacteria bacterium]|nr:TrfA family protein [Deltaproteobacteria bacterium]
MTHSNTNLQSLSVPLQNIFDRVEETHKEREAAKVYQLSLWKDPQRGVPNEFVRSALFPAIQPNKARYVRGETIFSQNGFTITFTGRQLTQCDLDVYEAIMHLARGTQEGNKVRFTAYQLLKLLHRHTGKSQYKWLLDVLQGLTATAVSIERDGKRVFWGSLLPKGAADLEDGKFTVEISREMIQLFSRGYTVIEEAHRRQLAGKHLAKALHGWICSHEKPHPVTVQFLHELTGSDTKALKKFRQNLKIALDDIRAIGAITDWNIDDRDKVHIQKAPMLF